MRPGRSHKTAAGQGLEPQYLPPEGNVLPLDEPAILRRAKLRACPQNTSKSGIIQGLALGLQMSALCLKSARISVCQ